MTCKTARVIAPATLLLLTACGTGVVTSHLPFGDTDPGVPALSIDDVSLAEGETGSTTFAFTVTLDAAPEDGADVSVSWATADGTAEAGSDYEAGAGVLTFTSGGPLTQNIAVTVWGDAEAEPDETFSVELSAPSNATLAKATGVGQILADELPRISVADTSRLEGDLGTSALTFTVSLSREPRANEPITVAWASSDGSAVAGVDYEAASGEVTFAAGDGLAKTIAVQVLGDTDIEPDETLTLTLSAPTGAVIARATAVGTLLADDFPQVSIEGASGLEGDSSATPFEFTVSVDADPPAGYPLRVAWATASGTATANADFVASFGTLTFAPGEALTQSVSVDILDDAIIEPDETFQVELTSPQHGSTHGASAQGTIINDDFPEVSIASASILEGTGAGTTTLVFTVSVSSAPAPGYDVTIGWTTSSGSASAGSDYTAGSGTLTFTSSGAPSQDVSVTIVRDSTIEPDETFTVVLQDPTNVSIAAATATGTILADDFPTVSIAGGSVTEGNGDTSPVLFEVSLDAAPPAGYPLQVAWATADGTATSPSDYLAGTGTLTFSPGDPLTTSVAVAVYGDTDIEPDETFTVTLASPINGSMTATSAEGTITNDDFPEVSIASASILEGTGAGATTLVFAVSVSSAPAPGYDVTTGWTTSNGTASAGSDYVAGSGTLTFTSSGASTQSVSVTIVRDSTVEPDETFTVMLQNAINVSIAAATATGTILADDFPQVSIAGGSVTEGNSGATPLAFAVSLSAGPPTGYPLQVAWATADGTATAPADYEAASGTLTFDPGGAQSQSVSVNIVGDTIIESSETFTVTISSPVNGTLGTAVVTGTIIDDDTPQLCINTGISVSEGTGAGTTSLTFSVALSLASAVGSDVTVSFGTSGGTATAGSDYTAISGSLTFTSGGPMSQSVTVPITRDAVIEPDETVQVTLSGAVNATITCATGTGTIQADDFPTVSIGGVSALEGNAGTTSFAFPVNLSDAMPTGYNGIVTWSSAAGTALAGSDYITSSGSLTFTPGGALTQNVTVSVLGDRLEEPDETFTVSLSNPVNLSIITGTATGTIVSDDAPKASISDATVYEGNSGTATTTFTVTLSSEALSGGRNAQVAWASAQGSASAPSDFAAGSGTLTFVQGGSLTQNVSITVNGDTVVESDELFTITLTSVANVTVDEGIGVGTILDDDEPSVSINDITALEGNTGTTAFEFTVSVHPAPLPGKDVSVSWSTGARTASAPADFAAASGSLTFTSAGPSSQSVTVNVVGEATKEVNEEFAVNLSGVVNGRLRDGIGIGTIVDDDGVIIRVDLTGSGADGLTWASAYQTVQAGVNRASALGGGQVWIAAGRYTNGASAVLNMLAGVSIAGGFEGYRGGAGAQETSFLARDVSRFMPVLDGDNLALHTVTVSAANTVLDGVKVIGGNAVGASPDHRGGGVYVSSGQLLLANAVIANNAAATYGGGVYLGGSTRIRQSRIYGNRVSGCNNGGGGGLYHSSGADVLDTDIKANSVNCYYGGGFNGGGATYRRCRVIGNTARHGGGGQSISSPITLHGCTFIGNVATSTSGGYENNSWTNDRIYDSIFMRNSSGGQGGGLMLRDSSASVVRSRVEENEAPTGGGLYVWNYFGGVQQLVQVRVANNRASSNGGGMALSQASPVLVNMVLEGNTAPNGGGLHLSGSSPVIRNSTFMNNAGTTGPELYLTQVGGTSPIASNPVAANTILWNRTSGAVSVATVSCAGCSFTSSSMSMTDAGQDAQLALVPVRTLRASSGTVTTLNITNASSFFTVNDVVEIQDDGVARAVSAVTATQITFAPALAAAPPAGVRVDNWGEVPTDIAVDLRLQATSACVDAGDNTLVGVDLTDLDGDGNVTEPVPYDYSGAPRFNDDPSTNTGIGTPPYVDIGALER